jgi:hypothetical protein
MNATGPNVQAPVQAAAQGPRARRPWTPPRLTHEAVHLTETKSPGPGEFTHDGALS